MRIHRVIPAEDSASGSCVGKRPGAGSSQGAEGDPACYEGCGDDQSWRDIWEMVNRTWGAREITESGDSGKKEQRDNVWSVSK